MWLSLKDRPQHAGYGSRSTLEEIRFNWQRGLRESQSFSSTKAVPEGRTEIVGRLPQTGRVGIVEVVTVEITLVTDFTRSSGKKKDQFSEHKAKQIFNNLIILKRKYDSDVPVQMIYFVPFEPTEDTKKLIVDALNRMDMPNVKIRWIVVST